MKQAVRVLAVCLWLGAAAALSAQDKQPEQQRPAPDPAVVARSNELQQKIRELNRQAFDEGKLSVADFRAEIEKVRQEMPRLADFLDMQYTGFLLEKREPGALEPWLRTRMESDNPDVVRWAMGELARQRLRREPMELVFTALDGREVDVGKLRGKVVLIDFWGTWCGYCIEELPTLKRVYQEYRDKGFEVVGIACDADRQVLSDFIAKNEVPWPQQFDGGMHFRNGVARQFGVMRFPTTFLLGKDGRVAQFDVRGDGLEPAVKKLLGS